jgi:hypothetical protein
MNTQILPRKKEAPRLWAASVIIKKTDPGYQLPKIRPIWSPWQQISISECKKEPFKMFEYIRVLFSIFALLHTRKIQKSFPIEEVLLSTGRRLNKIKSFI